MRRYLPLLLIIGLCLSISSVLLMAQEDDEPADSDQAETEMVERPEYAGSRECRDCHRDYASAHRETAHALTMVEIEEDMEADENPIVADFALGEDLRTVDFPDGSSRAFTVADVAFTLGAGRHVQAFIYAAEGESTSEDDEDEASIEYFVLPAQWNVINDEWETLDLAASWPDDAYAYGPNCAGCHTVGLDVTTYEWEEESVMCETCHGPGLEHVLAADDAGGSIDDEERALIYDSINLAYDGATCGQCHARGLATDGIHPYPVGYFPGMTELSDAFNLAAMTDDTHWWPSGHARLPNMQYNEAVVSAHPNGLASAMESENFSADCLTCHSVAQQLVDLRLSNEDIDPATVDLLALAESAPFGVTCASCHNAHIILEDEDEDTEDSEAVAMPEAQLIAESYMLCVSCHSDNDVTDGVHHPVQQVFEGVTIVEGIDVNPSPHFTAEDGPDCATCHMPTISTYNGDRDSHTFNIVSPGDALDLEGLQDSCSGCHDEGPVALQQLIDDIQNDALSRIERARAAVTDDSPAWVTLALDVVEGEGSAGIHNYTYTDTLLDEIEQALNLLED